MGCSVTTGSPASMYGLEGLNGHMEVGGGWISSSSGTGVTTDRAARWRRWEAGVGALTWRFHFQ